MKKNRTYMLLVLLIALALVVNPAFAKPKPPVDPYPAPQVEQVQGDAYPGPGAGLPGVQDFQPDDPDPRPGIPYFWGCFMESTGYWRCYITIDIGYPDFSYTGFVQLVSNNNPHGYLILNFRPHSYLGELGRMSYWTLPFQECGDWSALYANLDGIGADIRQPNWYVIKCIFIPHLKRQG